MVPIVVPDGIKSYLYSPQHATNNAQEELERQNLVRRAIAAGAVTYYAAAALFA